MTYTLTTQQVADTIGANPNGFFLLVDITDSSTNLGYNTIVQDDFSNINVYITNTNQLVFNNRFVPSLGNKQLQLTFITGPPNFFGVAITTIMYNAVILTYPFYSNNTLNNSQISLTETNSYFNLTYTLSSQQLANTIVAYPNGFYILTDITDSSTNLGYNTIVQNDFNNINVYITNTNQLVFNNRFVPSLGNKQLQLTFITGPPDFNGILVDTISYDAIILPYKYPCFKEGSKILTDKGYLSVENLRKGDLVKTLKHGFIPINMIGKKEIFHPATKDRIKEQLYQCNKDNFGEEIFEPLVITGCHSILVDNSIETVSIKQIEKVKEVNGGIYLTDGKLRMPSSIHERTTVYENKGLHTIYHFALNNDDYYMNYGIYANGLLVETCSKRYLKELSNMTLE
jgi:hypothetical protein